MSVVQEGHKLSVMGAEWEEGGGYSLHVEVPIVYDVTVATSGQGYRYLHYTSLVLQHGFHPIIFLLQIETRQT